MSCISTEVESNVVENFAVNFYSFLQSFGGRALIMITIKILCYFSCILKIGEKDLRMPAMLKGSAGMHMHTYSVVCSLKLKVKKRYQLKLVVEMRSY